MLLCAKAFVVFLALVLGLTCVIAWFLGAMWLAIWTAGGTLLSVPLTVIFVLSPGLIAITFAIAKDLL